MTACTVGYMFFSRIRIRIDVPHEFFKYKKKYQFLIQIIEICVRDTFNDESSIKI